MSLEKLLLASEAAAILRISTRTLRRRRLAGLTPGAFWNGATWVYPESCVAAIVEAMRGTPLTRIERRTESFQDAQKQWRCEMKERITRQFFPEYRRRKAAAR